MTFKRGVTVICAFSAVLAPILTHAQRVPAGARPPDVVYIAGKPRIVVANDATDCWWSPTGRFALVLSTRDDTEGGSTGPTRLVSINATAGAAAVVWKSTSSIEVIGPAWFAGTSIALVQVRPPVDSDRDDVESAACPLLRVDTRTGCATVVQGVPTAESLRASPTTPVVVALRTRNNDSIELTALRLNGTVARTLRVPAEHGLVSSFGHLDEWCDDGVSIRFTRVGTLKNAGGDPTTVHTWQTWNTVTGELSTSSSEPSSRRPASLQHPISLTDDPVIIPNGPAKVLLRPVWLVQGSGKSVRRQLINPDSDWSEISPNNSAILVRCRGAVSLTSLTRVTGDALDKLRETERAEALRRVKKVGLALRMYMDDYDSALPSPGDGFGSAISPYLDRPESIASPGTGLAFIYAPPSTAVQAGPEAASTVLGYLPMDNGRAVVYGDGHAAWVPN